MTDTNTAPPSHAPLPMYFQDNEKVRDIWTRILATCQNLDDAAFIAGVLNSKVADEALIGELVAALSICRDVLVGNKITVKMLAQEANEEMRTTLETIGRAILKANLALESGRRGNNNTPIQKPRAP